LVAALWPQGGQPKPQAEDLFVFEEEDPPPPPEPPPMPDPEPSSKVISLAEEPPPTTQFGFDEGALSETGDLAVVTGNTVMKEAEEKVEPTPPPLLPQPVFVKQPPRILKGLVPEYPAQALDRGLEASVTVLITIDTTGKVTEAAIEKGGGRDFDAEVLRAARGTVFLPPTRNGRRLPARFRRPYEFRLE
jgi:protein TonB